MLSISELLRRSFILYFQNFATVFKIIVWLLAAYLLFIFLPIPNFQESLSLAKILQIAPVVAFLFLLNAWTDQMLTAVLYKLYKGESAEIKESAKTAARRLAGYVIVMILLWLIVTLGFLFLIIPGFIFFTWYLFILPVFVVERLNGFKVFKRSHELIRGYGLRIFGQVFLSFFLFFVIVFFLHSLSAFVFSKTVPPAMAGAVLAIVSTTLSRLAMPLFTSVIVILYDELKKLKG